MLPVQVLRASSGSRYGLIGNGALRMMRPGVLQPPGGSRCVDGRGASGRPADAGTGSGARSMIGASTGATSSASIIGCAGAGTSRRTLFTTALVPRDALGAREIARALGEGVRLCDRSLADMMSSFGVVIDASWTSPPPTVARSRLRSSLIGAWDELEHAATVASATMPIEIRSEFRME